MDIYNLVSFVGLFILIFVAWTLSARRNVFNTRVVVWGTVLQLVFGAIVFLVPAGVFYGRGLLVLKTAP